MTSKEEVARFIRSSFRSVWSFELLLLLKRNPRRWEHSEIVASLRGSDLVVHQGLEGLVAAGLADLDEAGRAAYAPVNEAAAALVDDAERLYASRPDHVRRLIVSGSAGGLAAF